MESSAEQKLQKFKMLLSKSKFDFSVAEKELAEAFLAAISEPEQLPSEKIPLVQKEPQIQILKTKTGKGLWVGGKTFDHKDQLKELGGGWNKYKKAWIFPLEKQQSLLDLFKLTEEDIGVEPQ